MLGNSCRTKTEEEKNLPGAGVANRAMCLACRAGALADAELHVRSPPLLDGGNDSCASPAMGDSGAGVFPFDLSAMDTN